MFNGKTTLQDVVVSKTEPATLLAIFVADDSEKDLVEIDKK